MKKVIVFLLCLVAATFTANATDILLSKSGNPQLDGLYKSAVDKNGEVFFSKITEGVTFSIARFIIPTNQKNGGFKGWLITDATGKEYFGFTGESTVPPADGWDVGRAGIGLNANFDLTFRDEAAAKPTAFTLTNTPSIALNIYPNPTMGEINVASDTPIRRLILTNLAGQTVMNEQNTRLNLANLPTGTYLLTIETAAGKSVRRIIKQ
jgi:hypothetical protein